jgi:hypothetical protein
MKFVFLAGGFAGFALAAAAGWSADRAADRILFDAALGCLAGALLFRWFWTILVGGIRETLLARHAEAVRLAAAEAEGKTPVPAAAVPNSKNR